ncbi:SDR family oxidoreductase [Yinghuangia seranimata]|uniref:SDR family oxidoreductase n=1 Tax=Yinghuangia seranimata TaxID=408067 RepID=UPI00248BA060|nr:SDR family oxidoreductase [Yinghuangia seranimata]MDI2132302.1 SDR family oxidoreductase [Yinghuangia seranimata]
MSGRARVLVTGASGVLGTALLAVLDEYEVVAAVHRRLPAGSGRVVQLDLTAPRLGLEAGDYRRLCAEVDVVVHSAAIVNFTADQAEVDRVNIEGLGRVVEFAADADALLVHVSTAFVVRHVDLGGTLGAVDAAKSSARPDEYVSSKLAGERMVRGCGLDAVIVRPSVIIGDSRTGEMRQSQGVHSLAEATLRGTIPFIPAVEGAQVDVVPQDYVARCVRAVLDSEVRDGDYWATAGEHALSIPRFIELVREVGGEAGLVVPEIRIVEPSIVDRLVRPAFEDVLSPEDLKKLDGLLAVCGFVVIPDKLPSSLDALIAGEVPLGRDDYEEAWRVSVRRLIRELNAPNRHAPAFSWAD